MRLGCGENINSDLNSFSANRDSLTAISFEDYDLGSNSALIYNGFTSVNEQVKSMGLEAWPMITTVDLAKIQQVCQNPTPFITDAVNR